MKDAVWPFSLLVSSFEMSCFTSFDFQSRLLITHLSDNHGEKDEHLSPGLGNINWPATLEAILLESNSCAPAPSCAPPASINSPSAPSPASTSIRFASPLPFLNLEVCSSSSSDLKVNQSDTLLLFKHSSYCYSWKIDLWAATGEAKCGMVIQWQW